MMSGVANFHERLIADTDMLDVANGGAVEFDAICFAGVCVAFSVILRSLGVLEFEPSFNEHC